MNTTENMEGDKTSIIPFCEISNAQLSFHGHKDPVRFLVPVLAGWFFIFEFCYCQRGKLAIWSHKGNLDRGLSYLRIGGGGE